MKYIFPLIFSICCSCSNLEDVCCAYLVTAFPDMNKMTTPQLFDKGGNLILCKDSK